MQKRITFGFARTTCACAQCVLNCHHILIPEDLPELAATRGYDDWASFARENLAASAGATVLTQASQVLTIPTLVPQRQANGACKFLNADDRCTIHAQSPYGCRAFDCRQSRAEADARSLRGLQAIATDWEMHGMYARLWVWLDTHGLRAV